MDPITQQGAITAAGKIPDYVGSDNVFRAIQYHGTGNTIYISTPKCDISDGGIVITKTLGINGDYHIFNKDHGSGKYQRTSSGNSVGNMPQGVHTIGSESFAIGNDGAVNTSAAEHHGALCLKKQEHFFDIVEYTGNGSSAQVISHNLGSTPGMIWVKSKEVSGDWIVYHVNQGGGKYAKLNNTNEFFTNFNFWNNTTPNASTFTVGSDGDVNHDGRVYTAYIFGHNQARFGEDENEVISKCGIYTGNGNTGKRLIDIGFEPSFLMIKAASRYSPWHIFCSEWGMKGVGHNNSKSSSLHSAGAHGGNYRINVHPSGFMIYDETNSDVNSNGHTYIYYAIRKDNRVPETPTDVFEDSTRLTTTGKQPRFSGCGPQGPDFVIYNENQNNTDFQMSHKFVQTGRFHALNDSSGYYSDTSRYLWERQGGFGTATSADSTRLAWMFKRGKKFCDMITYYGNESSNAIRHDLGIAPKMVWVKRSGGGAPFTVFLDAPQMGGGKFMFIKDGTADTPQTSSSVWDNTAPSDTYLYLGNNSNVNSFTYHDAYLFGDCPGISKLGHYSGANSSQTITTGFQPRVVMIKNLTYQDPWWWCNTLLGMGSGNDTVLQLGSTANSYSGYNIVDISATGFTVVGTNRRWNESGHTYFYWAIA